MQQNFISTSRIKTELYVVTVHHYLLLFIRNFLLGLSLGLGLIAVVSVSVSVSGCWPRLTSLMCDPIRQVTLRSFVIG